MPIHEQVTRYAVSVIPDGHPLRRHFTITVDYRGEHRWAVLYEGSAMSRDGGADHEPLASNRDEEWLAAHRFAEDEALALARELAPQVRCNGRTAEQAMQWWVSESD
jgi:hypothetical protein